MRKLKKTCKKAKGVKARLKREEFLDRLKNPQKYTGPATDEAAEILKKIRERNKRETPSPYDASAKRFDKLKRLAGLR